MLDVNKIILIGRLGADPVRRETKNGLAVVNFSLATSRRVKKDADDHAYSGQETVWHRIVAWGTTAEHCAQYLRKGRAVFIEGSIRSRQYEGKDGASRTSVEVHADSVNFLDGLIRKEPEPSEEMLDQAV